jgi:hypothetical protein
MVEEKEVSLILSIVSLALAFLSPAGGIVITIISLVYNKKDKSKRAKTISIIAIIVSLIMIAVGIGAQVAMMKLAQQNTGGFPVY